MTSAADCASTRADAAPPPAVPAAPAPARWPCSQRAAIAARAADTSAAMPSVTARIAGAQRCAPRQTLERILGRAPARKPPRPRALQPRPSPRRAAPAGGTRYSPEARPAPSGCPRANSRAVHDAPARELQLGHRQNSPCPHCTSSARRVNPSTLPGAGASAARSPAAAPTAAAAGAPATGRASHMRSCWLVPPGLGHRPWVEGAHLARNLGGAAPPVDAGLALVDFGGIGRAFGRLGYGVRRPCLSAAQSVEQQRGARARASRCCSSCGGVIARSATSLPRQHGAGIETLVHLHDGDAGFAGRRPGWRAGSARRRASAAAARHEC